MASLANGRLRAILWIQTYDYSQADLSADVSNRYPINPAPLTGKYAAELDR